MAVSWIRNPRLWWARHRQRIILDGSSVMMMWISGRAMYSKRFTQPDAETWLNENCPSGWDWKPIRDKPYLVFYNENEALSFRMRWM